MSKKRIIGAIVAAIGIVAFLTYWALNDGRIGPQAVILLPVTVVCVFFAHIIVELAAAEEPPVLEENETHGSPQP